VRALRQILFNLVVVISVQVMSS